MPSLIALAAARRWARTASRPARQTSIIQHAAWWSLHNFAERHASEQFYQANEYNTPPQKLS